MEYLKAVPQNKYTLTKSLHNLHQSLPNFLLGLSGFFILSGTFSFLFISSKFFFILFGTFFFLGSSLGVGGFGSSFGFSGTGGIFPICVNKSNISAAFPLWQQCFSGLTGPPVSKRGGATGAHIFGISNGWYNGIDIS